MCCTYDKEKLISFLSGEMEEQQCIEIQDHLTYCNSCKEELADLKKVWDMMEAISIEKPSASMQAGFNIILKHYKEERGIRKSALQKLFNQMQQIWHLQPRLQLAYSFILLLTGLAAGYFLSRPVQAEWATRQQINSLSSQLQEMKQTMVFSLLENPSASERIRAVNYTNDINKADKQIINALLTTLNNDPNVNVRLITLEALVKFSHEPSVREGLIESIMQQESPMMQSAIADVMVKLQEKRSVKPLQELLNRKDLNETVKTKIKESIHQLI